MVDMKSVPQQKKQACFPNPQNTELAMQSVVAEGSDWGASAHRLPVYSNGVATWPVELLRDTPGRTTTYQSFQTTVSNNMNRPYLGERTVVYNEDGTTSAGDYKFITFKEASETATYIGSGLKSLGVAKNQPVGLYSKNRMEWTLTDHALSSYTLPSVAIYDTLGPESVHYVMEHSEMVAAFFEKIRLESVLAAIGKGLPNLKFAICFEVITSEDKVKFSDAGVTLLNFYEVADLGSENVLSHDPPTAEDVAVLMYTSGTTGNPKGVQITHRNVMSDVVSLQERLRVSNQDVHFSFLPLAHIFERVIQALCVSQGCSIGFYQGKLPELMLDIQTLKPTFFIAVPRILSRIYDKINQGIKAGGPEKEAAFKGAYNMRLAALERGEDTPILNEKVFNRMGMALGGRVKWILTGSAPLGVAIHEFLRVCVCPVIMVGYGLTETTAGATITHYNDMKLGHVGSPMASNEVKLVSIPEMNYLTSDEIPRGEVCVRGTNVFGSYLKNPEKTKEDIDEEGWFHTGDVGRWNADGTLSIIDRQKSIFKLSQGEYLAAENLEAMYGKCDHIAQVFVTGDSFHAYPVAVVVPDSESIVAWAKANNVSGDARSIAQSPELKALLTSELLNMHKECKLKGFEKLRDFIVEPELFSIDNELLTPTFKLKRVNATKKYKDQITDLYDAIENPTAPVKVQSEITALEETCDNEVYSVNLSTLVAVGVIATVTGIYFGQRARLL
ncbi:hypothetical protein SARC_09056 [Sphaeroforma arctica JP610]|uniref:Long-chain-fatty-acid--CoA ligase n=1 Tax=Sphaeroforma arctica JP610 TaxID=667725 RepID=A0A0L0FNV8_9EUKA|nr:hypothetical protein SARC_09056 [Sphaeroforma arctica JP610]KNC78520.1 hypothetical protein SARC_09056 [Sphaeroforma arctica JP610]|eukprot:XP_014152422.1 hypothetical protein SARC_09056 [Sphaeroforma arctica JP610]